MTFLRELCDALSYLISKNFFFFFLRRHSKNTRVSVTRKRVHWGQTPFRVKDDPEIDQLSADLATNWVRLTQLWDTFRVKLTDFRVVFDPARSLAPMDPFRVNISDPGVFRVYTSSLSNINKMILIIIMDSNSASGVGNASFLVSSIN